MINRSTHAGVAMFAGVVLLVLQPASARRATAADIGAQDLAKLVGQPADIASSAYQYRADLKAEQNPLESWLPESLCFRSRTTYSAHLWSRWRSF